MCACVNLCYRGVSSREIYLFSTDDFWKGRRAEKGVLCINRAEETEGAREWDSHKLHAVD